MPWRAAVKILELRYSAAPVEPESLALPSNSDDIANLSWRQMRTLAASLITISPNDDAMALEAGDTTETTS